MLLITNPPPEDRWDRLQEQTPPSEIPPQFRVLLAALDLGWRIEEPVYLRPRWSDQGPSVYHFILHLGLSRPPRLISVPQCPEIDAYVKNENIRLFTSR